VIREFSGNGDKRHQANFIEAVQKQDRSILNAEIEVGNDSTGWCNLANIAFRAGREFTREAADQVDLEQWQTVLGEMDDHLKAHDLTLDSDAIRLSPMLQLDSKTEQFVGEHADTANQFIKREYRKGYEVPGLA
jgi:hypothetical protein